MPNKDGIHFKKAFIFIRLSATDLSIKILLSAKPNKATVQLTNKTGKSTPASTPDLCQINTE